MSLTDVAGLRKSYGPKEVLTGIDLRVEVGEIVGILGPNGSGKTTAVECIGGLRTPDGGTISVDGIDPQTNESELREILGMQLQEARLPAKMTTAEAFDLFASFYPDPEPTGARISPCTGALGACGRRPGLDQLVHSEDRRSAGHLASDDQ